ncbi:MAG: selenide, water dikinase SelD [Pseudomonadota bacterium]
MQHTPVVRELVLIGGGHAHVQVLKRFAMRPLGGVRVTLVSREAHTPYSGMLPGLVAGHYSFDESHIDLAPLARFATARFIHDEVTGLDPVAKTIETRTHPPLRYDLLSIDIGSAPSVAVPGSSEYAVPVKPVSRFNTDWVQAKQRILNTQGPQTIAVVGGGAGGVELLLSIRQALLSAEPSANLSFSLLTSGADLLAGHNGKVRKAFGSLFKQRQIQIVSNAEVSRVEAGKLVVANGDEYEADEIFWVTQAAAQQWPGDAGLAVDENGFIRVDACLRSINFPDVFACGDIAAVDPHPRPKSGVFAVRQGPPLTDNLKRQLMGREPKPFAPQKAFLSLISTGDKNAIASRNNWSVQGRWVWHWKDWIDRRFMRKFNRLPEMDPRAMSKNAQSLSDPLLEEPMHCAGCGSKVAAETLSAALADLKPVSNDRVRIGLAQSDDAAVVAPARDDTLQVHTVDQFRAMVSDPYLFGKLTAHHCLNDIFAMGATPETALAIVTLPHGSTPIVKHDLKLVMHGAVEVLNEAQTTLVGGHTNEGPEMALGFAVNGSIAEAALEEMNGPQSEQSIILTRPLGSGVLFAGDMRAKAKSRWLDAAIEEMLLSNRLFAAIVREHGASAIKDVTGFGLIGHLGEMLRSSDVQAILDLHSVPIYAGAKELLAANIESSLQIDNEKQLANADLGHFAREDPLVKLACDPQTCGGLLACIPSANAAQALHDLHAAGARHSAVVGSLHAPRGKRKIQFQ